VKIKVKGSGQMKTFDLRLQPGSTKLVQVRGLRRLWVTTRTERVRVRVMGQVEVEIPGCARSMPMTAIGVMV
jgi:hypothetical protein